MIYAAAGSADAAGAALSETEVSGLVTCSSDLPAALAPAEDRARRRERDQGDALDQPGRVDGVGLGLGRHVPCQYQAVSRWPMWSATRRALAMAVSAGFTAPMLGKKLVSTT